jgi:hypothetical protein
MRASFNTRCQTEFIHFFLDLSERLVYGRSRSTGLGEPAIIFSWKTVFYVSERRSYVVNGMSLRSSTVRERRSPMGQMRFPAKRSGREPSPRLRRPEAASKRDERASGSPLEVVDVVRHGLGRGSRLDLTILSAGRRVRLTGLCAKHVLSYRRIEEAAMEQGLVLPWLRPANRVWRRFLAPAMEQARTEPWLEGEAIEEAIQAEIGALLEDLERGESASDLMEGKAVEQEEHMLVSPTALVGWVRKRLVDDVLPRATIAEAAAAHLGMRQVRPRFADGRPHAWAFPLPLSSVRESREAEALSVDERSPSKPVELGEAPRDLYEVTERGELEPPLGPVQDPRSQSGISFVHGGIGAGSSGPLKMKFDAGSGPPAAVPRGISARDDEMRVGSSGPAQNGFRLRVALDNGTKP